MVMSAELVLAAVGGADICLRYGKRLVNAYEAFRSAGKDIKAKVLIIEAMWVRTAIHVEFVKRIAKSLREEHCRIHAEVFEMLQSKLMKAIAKVESITKQGGQRDDIGSQIKRWKYMLVRETITETMRDLEQWQRLFDPTWFLVLRMSDGMVDSELSGSSISIVQSEENRTCRSSGLSSSDTLQAKEVNSSSALATAQKLRMSMTDNPGNVHITLSEDGLDWETGTEIAYSTTRIIHRTGSQKPFAVDTIRCESGLDVARARVDAEALARKLKQIDHATFSLLPCQGLIKRKNPDTGKLSSINLAFRLPSGQTHAESLRGLLIRQSPSSLTRVLSIACQLAKGVSFIHTCDFVHKNIRPETILVFPNLGSPIGVALGSAYLLGFDSFRNVNFLTMRVGDAAWERNLYRHPSRQGLHAQDSYIMQHDVYSLGVCLLELGLWETFVEYDNAADGTADKRARPSSYLGLEVANFDFGSMELLQTPSKIKDYLVDMARSRLPLRMGDKYTAVVVTCLTCLDEDNEDFGDQEDMRDDDGILIGVRFVERVLLRLTEISL
ncbi:hypothetical protein F4778DRAFT_377622 [Xylariomycetidae sp. FL2044]|nr:hypothetical protein F4778DRAFT_377622 [Xylariomycetidae sp. FL2044]